MEGDSSIRPCQEGIIQRGRGKNKRFWTSKEDDVLIKSLFELARDSKWKSENGFKNGYMLKLEDMICLKLPQCGLKAEPHISSRIKHWSEKFNALVEMLSLSGFGWDDVGKRLQCEKIVYDDWVKNHKKAKGLYGVPFPYFDMLSEVFGKDRVTGGNVEIFDEAINNIDIEIEPETVNLENGDEDTDDEAVIRFKKREFLLEPPSKKMKRAKTNKEKEPKSVKHQKDATYLNLGSSNFISVLQNINTHLATMANAWLRAEEREQRAEERKQRIEQAEKEMIEKSNNVLEEVLKLEVISPSEALEVASILMTEEPKLRLFYQAPVSLRRQYVKDLLKK